jgi:hypothetical protein
MARTAVSSRDEIRLPRHVVGGGTGVVRMVCELQSHGVGYSARRPISW